MQEQAEEKGRRLGFLIAALNIEDDAKEAMINLLTKMTQEQINKLTQTLEADFLHAVTNKSDEELVKALLKNDAKFEEKIQKINETTEDALDNL